MNGSKYWQTVFGVLLGLGATLFPLMSAADEVGSASCGPAFTVRGDVMHAAHTDAGPIKNATDPSMYKEEIYGSSFTAFVPGLPEGFYTVEIYLAESYFTEAGARVMDIFCGSEALAEDLDLVAEVGALTEYVIRKEVVHKEDVINGPLSIRFSAKVDNAKLNGIRVKNADGAIMACVNAVDLHLSSPDWASGIPEIEEPALYMDASLPVSDRVDDLVRRMSLGEKVSQLMNSAPSIDRLGVPGYDYWNECLHGVARAGNATVFPQAIGMAAMWDTDMLHTVADTIATEGRAKNNAARAKDPTTAKYYGLTFWTPNINIFRDPRWGRGQETYGEDPYLTSRLGVAFIQGLQGDDPNYVKAMACAKHYAVHSGPEKERHTFNVDPAERDLYETYLPQFEAAVREADVGIVMSVYNAVYGVPGPASKFLLTDLLRDKWGFDGHVVSDCGAVRDIWVNHKYTETRAEACAAAILAGNDINCGSAYGGLTEAVQEELITEEQVDTALKRVLTSRFLLGLFDSPEECDYLKIPASENDSAAHSQLALEAAQKSMVLLKNDGVLPLDRKRIKRIAVIGPNADSVAALLGNYNGDPSSPITILAGIKAAVGDAVEVEYARGCPAAIRRNQTFNLSSDEAKAALALAKRSDVVLYVGGLDANLEGEEMRNTLDGFDNGDRTVIELPKPQETLLKGLSETGTPVVFVNLSGSAIAMPWAVENIPAILQAWYPGQNGGTAVADVLFGNVNPAGRLPITFYRSTADLPDFRDYSMENRTYRYFEGKPLYAFGHGLSYTSFKYGEAETSATQMKSDGSVKVRVRVTNMGDRAGDEVVQLYVRHLDSTVAQPLHSLAGFKRISLEKGGSSVVEFELPATALRYWDEERDEYVVAPGSFEIQVGAASDDIRTTCRMKIVE
ncbi:MAG: glycoside hydrolase family 3 C-terminal domain-containing protein [Pontiellaceae bacterium]|nr:glycoside hydrolase family 3 C-terminal domain-containing protein [Pontiellaceae bacterium]